MPLPHWVEDYARRRYGPGTPEAALKAWQRLLKSVYNATDCHTDHSRDIPTSRPGLAAHQVPCRTFPPAHKASASQMSSCMSRRSLPDSCGQYCGRLVAGDEAVGSALLLHPWLTASGGLMQLHLLAGLAPWEIGLWGLRPHLWYDPSQV